MEPLTEGRQRCLEFRLTVRPRANIFGFRDHQGCSVHHFDVAEAHDTLLITAESLAEIADAAPVPESLPTSAWNELDRIAQAGEHWDYLHESRFARNTPALVELARTVDRGRSLDPLRTLLHLNRDVYDWFDYVPNTTNVDSPIDEALRLRAGVCQDFAHVMVALIRRLGIPCRYVSGYLHHGREDHDRSGDDATHAWVEAYLPELGWLGLDPTNALVAGGRHIRVAVGRDYADVPPTHGVFKGGASSELSVAVRVKPGTAPAPPDASEQALTRQDDHKLHFDHPRVIQQQQQQQQ